MSLATQQPPTAADALNRFRVVRRVPLFDEHPPVEKSVRTPGGTAKLSVGCTASDLAEMASNANIGAANNRPPLVQIGHSSFEDVPEPQWPRTVGRTSNHVIGDFEGRPCLFGDLHILASEYDNAATYPRASIERVGWDRPGRQTIRAVALIRRDPERDLGIINYQRERRLCYSKERTMNLAQITPTLADPALRKRVVDHAVRKGLTASESLAEIRAESSPDWTARPVTYSKESPVPYPSDPAVRAKCREFAERHGIGVSAAWERMVASGLASR